MTITIRSGRTEREIADSTGDTPARRIARIRETRDYGMRINEDVTALWSVEFTWGLTRNGDKVSAMFDTIRETWVIVTGNQSASTWVLSVIGQPVESGLF